jgi:predicted AAA+ superfamily ATPase
MGTAIAFSGAYVDRIIDRQIDVLFAELPALLLDGPKGVGKTATAARRCVTTRYLDDLRVAEVIGADPSILGTDPEPVLIDEWQRVDGVWDAVRRLVDAQSSAGRFLLTGSAPALGTHSGAGRITSLRMRPLCLAERTTTPQTISIGEMLSDETATIRGQSEMTLVTYVDEIMASGFPALRGLGDAALAAAIDGYLEHIVDHDLPDAGFTVRRPAAVRAWLRAYAAATATTASWERIRDAATSGVSDKPARSTTINYTELLTQLRILDPLEAWTPSLNHLGRLAVGPKHHLADPALAVRLLRRTRKHLLAGNDGATAVPNDGNLLGNLFESLASLTVRTVAQTAGASVYHLRTRDGDHEVDFIVEGDNGVVAFEVKLAGTVDDRDTKHLKWLRERIGARLLDAVVITTGPEAYRRPDGIAIVPLALLGP